MKTTRFLALTVALTPMTVMAGPLEELLGRALKAPTEVVRSSGQNTPLQPVAQTRESKRECTRGWDNNLSRDDLRMLDYKETPAVEVLCQQLREQNWCAENCEVSQRLRTAFDEVKSEREKRATTQQEEQRKASAQQQAQAAKESALRSGQANPGNLKEAAIVYNAEHGGPLASAPKIKPDGGMYYMHGKIKMAGEEPQFLAALSSSKENELLANALRRSRGMGESTDYFAVTIPKSLQKYYFDNAKIDSGFDVVGHYVSNTKYTTVSGQEKSAPVFEAVYFVLWQ